MFDWVRSWSSSYMGHLGSVCLSVCLSVCPSVRPHFLCAAITGILFYREVSNFVRMFVWGRSWSSSNMGHLVCVCLSVSPSVRPSTFFLCCDNWNTFLQRTFKLCIWVIYQKRRTPRVFLVNTSKVKVTGGALPDLVSILVHFKNT